MKKVVPALILCALMAFPGAVAFPGDAEGAATRLEVWELTSFNEHIEGVTTPGEYLNLTYNASKDHNLFTYRHELVFTIEIAATMILDSDGVWNLTFDQDDKALNACTGHIVTLDPGILGGDVVYEYTQTLHCTRLGSEALNNVIHNHTFVLDISVESGSPSNLEHLDVSVKIERQDIVFEPMDINIVNLEYWIPILFWIAAIIFALYWQYPWVAAWSIPGFMQSILPEAVPGSFAGYLLLALVGVILEYFKGRRQESKGMM